MQDKIERLQVIDTHTGGEPTRVVIAGGPPLDEGTLAERRLQFAREFDHYRSAVVNEPRGSDVLVGAWLCPPDHPDAVTGVIFFNNVGPLQMCGHGTIGVAVALHHMGKISTGKHLLDTPVGTVGIEVHSPHEVTIANVPAYRHRANVAIEVPGHGTVTGDIAWGGNWFFLVKEHDQELTLSRVNELTNFCRQIRQTLEREQITGAEGALIDHIELFAPPGEFAADSRNFVLCPGSAYDRSPCGTGTSAKLACLYEDGKLRAGESYRQASIIGSVFTGEVNVVGTQLIPMITGTAYVNAESSLLLSAADPFQFGIRS